MELSINYSPISIGRIRVWTQFSKATDALHQLGVLYVVCGVWDAWCVKCWAFVHMLFLDVRFFSERC